MTEFIVYDVFTAEPFGGNQLAIIPDAAALPEAALQSIAREFNFSETVFLYPPERAAHTAKLRIFTPTMEIPFAGHPTIGTAVALAERGHGPDMILELGIGPLAARAELGAANFTTQAPLDILAAPSPALVARALGLNEADIKMQEHAPTLATLGLPFTLTALKTRAALSQCEPDLGAFREGAARHKGALDFAQFAYFDDGEVIHARMFAPLDNIPEDPATGSAAATLGALLARLRGGTFTGTILQGADMGRPSQIGVDAAESRVILSGRACQTMSGQLHL